MCFGTPDTVGWQQEEHLACQKSCFCNLQGFSFGGLKKPLENGQLNTEKWCSVFFWLTKYYEFLFLILPKFGLVAWSVKCRVVIFVKLAWCW